jgi:hypothetical protein
MCIKSNHVGICTWFYQSIHWQVTLLLFLFYPKKKKRTTNWKSIIRSPGVNVWYCHHPLCHQHHPSPSTSHANANGANADGAMSYGGAGVATSVGATNGGAGDGDKSDWWSPPVYRSRPSCRGAGWWWVSPCHRQWFAAAAWCWGDFVDFHGTFSTRADRFRPVCFRGIVGCCPKGR